MVYMLGPVGNGRVICISVYAGEEFDFGLGPGKALWIDNIDEVRASFKLNIQYTQHLHRLKMSY